MIVMKKVRSGTYYTGKERDGYASVEREGVRLGLEFTWCETANEKEAPQSPQRPRPRWQAWKIMGTDTRRRRRIWKVAGDDNEASGGRPPWDGQRKTFGLMAIPVTDPEMVETLLDDIIQDELSDGREKTVTEKRERPSPDETSGFLVIDREGEFVTVSIYGGDPIALMGKGAYEKIQQVMKVLTGQLRPEGKPCKAESERPLPLRQPGRDRPWMALIAVHPESIHLDHHGTDNVWWGGLASRLGIEGAIVGHDDLELALDGYVPGLVEGKQVPVMSNAGHPRRKKGTDIVFAAPKAYSLLWAQADPLERKDLERLNRETVCHTLAWWVEKGLGFTEENNGGQWNQERDLLVALFEHGSSREKDPHLHTHCLVVNLTANGRRLVVNNRYTLAADYEYRRGLCAGLQKMGYPAFPSLVQGLGIKGIRDEDEEVFSRRRQMILELSQGRGPQVRRRIALLTRGAKVNSRNEIWRNEKWKMENGKWRMENGEWKMENGKWGMENGELDETMGAILELPQPEVRTLTDGKATSSVPSPLDVVRTITLNRGQIVALDEEVMALARLMHTRDGRSPDPKEIRQWLASEKRIVTTAGYWIETHLSEMDQRCREKIKSMLRDHRVTIASEPESTENNTSPPDTCWLSPGEIPPEKHLREQQGIRHIGLHHAHWWPASQLEPLLDNLRERLVLEMPLEGPPVPGYPARELWWKNETNAMAPEPLSGMEPGQKTCPEPATTDGQLMLPLQTRHRAPTGTARNMKDGYYQNGCGFHATADEFIANFAYDVMLHQRALVISDRPAEWEPLIRQKLLDMGMISPAPIGEFKGLSWRINERVGWQPQVWKREDWLWGEVCDLTCQPGGHDRILWVRTWKGELLPLREENVRSIRCGYVVHPSEIRSGNGLRCHYYCPRPTGQDAAWGEGRKRSGQDRRKEIAEIMQGRPPRGQFFIGIEPYRKRWHAPPHAPFLENERKGLPGIGPAGTGRNRKFLGLIVCLSQLGGGTWQLMDGSGYTDLNITPRQNRDRHREKSGQEEREWETCLLASVENVITGKNHETPWFLQWDEKTTGEHRMVVQVKSPVEWLAMIRGGLSMEFVTRLEDGYEIWMKWPRYENLELTPEALEEYLREICGVENFALLKRGTVPDHLWQCASGNSATGTHELTRLPARAWEKMQANSPEINRNQSKMGGM